MSGWTAAESTTPIIGANTVWCGDRPSRSLLIYFIARWLSCGFPWWVASVSWSALDLVWPVGAGECELQLNVPRQCWAGGFICSDRLLTVCDDERQLRVGTQHRLFSWQCELWQPEGAQAYISRPFAPINPSLKGFAAETPNAAQHDTHGLKQMELKGSGASISASWIYHAHSFPVQDVLVLQNTNLKYEENGLSLQPFLKNWFFPPLQSLNW